MINNVYVCNIVMHSDAVQFVWKTYQCTMIFINNYNRNFSYNFCKKKSESVLQVQCSIRCNHNNK